MNQKALLNGMEYTILDLLPSLDYSDRMVLCQMHPVRNTYVLKQLGKAMRCNPDPVQRSQRIVQHLKKSSVFSLFSGEGMICMPEDFIVSRPEKADIPPSAKTSGNMVCAIKKRINVRIARTGSLSP